MNTEILTLEPDFRTRIIGLKLTQAVPVEAIFNKCMKGNKSKTAYFNRSNTRQKF